MKIFVGKNVVEVADTDNLMQLFNYVNKGQFDTPFLAKVNNEIFELNRIPKNESNVEFLGLDDPNGFRAYQRSVSFLLIYAVKEILGKKTRIRIEHSINKNYFCELPDYPEGISDDLLEKFIKKMKESVNKAIPITKHSLPVDVAISLCAETGLSDKVKSLKYRRTSNVNLYNLDWLYDYFYGPMVINTKFLTSFKLIKKDSGFMIQFPNPLNKDTFMEVKSISKLTQVFKEAADWTKILKVETVGDLNDVICAGGISDMIRISEALHEKKLAQIADMIADEHKSLVLIAGPSSSGKTTFANRLSVQLRVNGLKPHVISLDNYYKNRVDVPLDEHGQRDFECLESLDLDRISEDLTKLLSGQEVTLPHFNFLSGMREDGHKLKLNHNEIIVMEGIHGLNEKLSQCVSRDKKFKIFISALTQINVDDHNRIPTTDTRLIRRVVRDSMYRGASAEKTMSMWPSVGRGEHRYIFPFQDEADAFFNSALVYELCVLKYFAEPLLFDVQKSSPYYAEARRLAKFLDCFLSISSEQVPSNSLLREFIGGSCFYV